MIIICERQPILLEAVLKYVAINLTELMLMTEKANENIFCIRVMASNYNGKTYNNCFAFGDIWGSLAHYTTTDVTHAMATFETIQMFP